MQEVDLRASLASAVEDHRGTLGLLNPLGPWDPCFEDLLGLFSCLHSLVLYLPFPSRLAAH